MTATFHHSKFAGNYVRQQLVVTFDEEVPLGVIQSIRNVLGDIDVEVYAGKTTIKCWHNGNRELKQQLARNALHRVGYCYTKIGFPKCSIEEIDRLYGCDAERFGFEVRDKGK